MKVLGIIGSPRGRSGNTGQLLNKIIDKVEEMGVETELAVLKVLYLLQWPGVLGKKMSLNI